MIKLIGGPLDGREVDSANGPVVGMPNSDLDITVPDPENEGLTITHTYFVGPDGKSARFSRSSVATPPDTWAMNWTDIPNPIIRPPL